MQICVAGAAAGNGKGEANELRAIECADDLTADFLAHHEHAQRNEINVVKIPDFLLQRHAGIELVNAVAFSYGDGLGLGNCGHFFAASRVFACCHRTSISLAVDSSNVFPCARNFSSTRPKRRRNFLLVLRKADSGSTERCRAIFTSTKKRSPTSSSMRALSSSEILTFSTTEF